MQEDEISHRTVTLTFPRPDGQKRASHLTRDSEMWLRMLEIILESDFKDYTLTVTHDSYDQQTTVVVVFSNIEDAVFFKLQHGR